MSKATDRAGKRGTERRICPVQLEVRAASGGGAGKTLDGYATITDTPFEMWDMWGSYTEIIESGAFAKTLSENPQVQLLLNHGGVSMAYTKAGTLRLSEDSTGLHMSADLNTERTDVRDMVAAIADGAVDEMSFAFRVPSGKSVWVGEEYDQRNIKEVDIHRGDVSVVNFGAVPDTAGSLSLRAQDFDRLSKREALALRDRIEKRLSVVVVDIDDDEGEEDDVPCPSCSEMNADDAVYCDQCGASMAGATPSLSAGLPLSLASAEMARLSLAAT